MTTYDLTEDTLAELDLESFVELIARAEINALYTTMVGRIVEIAPDRSWCEVQPVIRQRIVRTDGDERIRHAVLLRVPLGQPHGGGMSLTSPVGVGDFVVVAFNDRSLDEWKFVGGDDVTPSSLRRYHCMDGLVLGTVRPLNKPLLSVEDGAILLGLDNYDDPDSNRPLLRLRVREEHIELCVEPPGGTKRFIRVDSAGKIAIGDEAGNELLGALSDALGALRNATAGGNALDPVTIGALDAAKAQIDALKA